MKKILDVSPDVYLVGINRSSMIWGVHLHKESFVFNLKTFFKVQNPFRAEQIGKNVKNVGVHT